jgi:WD40 repeat protein
VQTGKQVFEKGLEKPVASVAFSPDGKRVAAKTAGLLGVWEADTGKEVFTLELTPDNVEQVPAGLAFSPDGKTLAYRAGNSIKRCDAATGRALRDLPPPDKDKTVSCVAYSPDGKLLVAGTLHPKPIVAVLDAESGEVLRTFDHYIDVEDVVGLALGPGGGALAVAFCRRDLVNSAYDGRVRQFDLRTGKAAGPELPQKVNNAGFFCLAGSPDGSLLVTGGWDCVVRCWSPATGKERELPGRAIGYVSGFAFSPDGKTAACGSYDHTVRLFELGARHWGRTFRGREAPIYRLAFSPDGQTLAARAGAAVQLWDMKSGSQQQDWQLDVPGDPMAFRRDGKMLASVFWGEDMLRLWDVEAGKPGPALEKVPGRMSNSLAFSPDNGTLAAGFADKSDIVLWDSGTGKKKQQLTGPPADDLSAYALTFSPDGKTLAVAHSSATGPAVKLWDVATGQVRLTLPNFHRAVLDLAIRPDGKVLATAGADDATVRLWDPVSGRLLQSYALGPPAGVIHEIAFAPDGKRLAAKNLNGTVYILHPPQ